MAGVWKRDGTVAVTNGSKKVTGTGTTFADAKNGVAKGHLFCMTTGTTVDLYEVDYVVSNTELHLVQAFRGTTGTGKAYEIITTFSDSIPEFARKLNASLSYYQSQSDMVQQLFTSDAAEITVTAPDGTTHKLIPWKRVTSEGEGQAARAKVEADRAKNEADRAVAEADRAAGIVAAAALPLPDVWAPLSDSLRLFVGNGREVKVGDDVVARYVSYSRSTAATYTDKNDDIKVAAINEPRFERNGLLIGGGNPNLFNKSAASSYSWISSVLSQSAGSAQLPFDVFQKTITSSNSAQGSSERVIVDLYSISNPAALAGGPVTVSAYMFGDADAIVSASPELKVVADLSITGISRSVIKINSNTVRIIWSGVITPGSSSTFGNFQVTWLNRFQSVVVGCYQITMLPFVDSYIPTNGASATRAPDVVTLPQSLNLGEAQLGFSLAVEFDTVNTGPHRILELSDFSSIIADGASLTIRHAGKEVYGINAPLGQRHHIAYSVAADGAITVALNGKVLAPQSRGGGAASTKTSIILGNRWSGANDRAMYGHLRDLKIWTKKPLTADQLKVASA